MDPGSPASGAPPVAGGGLAGGSCIFSLPPASPPRWGRDGGIALRLASPSRFAT